MQLNRCTVSIRDHSDQIKSTRPVKTNDLYKNRRLVVDAPLAP